MDLASVCELCASLPGAEESVPFGPDVLVYKVAGKIFALTDPGDFPPRVNLKCNPDRAQALREEYPEILPGYHMNKRHWNTVVLEHTLPSSLVVELVRHSYALVVAALSGAARRDAGL